MTDDLLTAAQAAERLGCCVAHVKTLCTSGRVPARKLGGMWLIRADALAGITVGKPGWPKGKGRPRKEESDA